MAQFLDSAQIRPLDRVRRGRWRRALGMACAGLLVVVPLVGNAPAGVAAAPDGGRWRYQEMIQADTQLDDYGPVVQLPDGTTVALWTNARHRHLYAAQRPTRGSWTPPQDLSGPRSEVFLQRVVEAPRNKFTLAWRGTIDGQGGIWSRRFGHGRWTEPRLEVRPTPDYPGGTLSLATARGVVAVEWINHGDDSTVAVAVRRGAGEMTILPPLPTPMQYVNHLAVDRAGNPTVVARWEGRVLVTTYESDGTWVEEKIGPSPGYQLDGGIGGYVTAVSNRAGDLAVGWREIPTGGDDVGATRVRVRPNGGPFSPTQTLTTEADCYQDVCVTLGMDADGDVTAVYSTQFGERADIWFGRRDAATETWTTPLLLAHDASRYFMGAHATAPSGGSVIAIPAGQFSHLVYRCGPAGNCGSPTTLGPPGGFEVSVDSARGGAALLWDDGCADDECEVQTELLARVYE